VLEAKDYLSLAIDDPYGTRALGIARTAERSEISLKEFGQTVGKYQTVNFELPNEYGPSRPADVANLKGPRREQSIEAAF
jgi:hypothetical protein